MEYNFSFWVVFHCLIIAFLAVDLFFLDKGKNTQKLPRLIFMTLCWIGLSLAFNVWVFFALGPQQALAFFGAYLLEKSLSIDNLFVFLMIFSSMRIPKENQKKILFWGVIGAIFIRLLFILVGADLLHRFDWMYYVFGSLLCFGALRFFVEALQKNEQKPGWLSLLTKSQKWLCCTEKTSCFFEVRGGRVFITRALLTLVIVEIADLIFAIDSVPAVLALTSDVFIAYTSNVFAILGLRALYLVLAHYKDRIPHFSLGLSIILLFIGGKMLIADFYVISASATVLFVMAVILISLFSTVFRRKI